ncbi:MAG TPA: hypothetical protein VGV35_10430 [Bryobacteraceae bacterium]|nr:hypothetical protein [Bryobacteraceae bacterium]
MLTIERKVKKVEGRGLARFFELRGREITESAGVLWYGVPGRIFISSPPQLLPDPEPADIRSLLRRTRGLGVRYPSVKRPGLASGLYVCRNKDYELRSVQNGLRGNIRRGLENCEVRRVPLDDLLAQGLELNLDTMERQGHYDAEFGEASQWRRMVEAMDQCAEITPWGAFVGDRLAAYAITCQEDGWLHILHRMSRLSDLELRPNQALDFTITRQLATDDDIEAICFGSIDLAAGPGLHEYKLGMGYEATAHNSVLELHPAAAPLLTSARFVGSLKSLRRIAPKNQFVERAITVFEGARMCRLGIAGSQRTEPVELKRIS